MDNTWSFYLELPNGKLRLRRAGLDGSSEYKDINPIFVNAWIGTDRKRTSRDS